MQHSISSEEVRMSIWLKIGFKSKHGRERISLSLPQKFSTITHQFFGIHNMQ
jgi:hypothetical protein